MHQPARDDVLEPEAAYGTHLRPRMAGNVHKARSEIRTSTGACPVGVALGVFRGRWKADVLYRLCAGPTGFGALLRALTPEGLTRTMLASTLHELEKDGVVCKAERWQGRVRRVDWYLTHAGEDLLPVFHALMAWGARHEPPATP